VFIGSRQTFLEVPAIPEAFVYFNFMLYFLFEGVFVWLWSLSSDEILEHSTHTRPLIEYRFLSIRILLETLNTRTHISESTRLAKIWKYTSALI